MQFNPNIEKHVWAIHDTILEAFFIRKRNVVIDNTNVDFDIIKKYLYIASKYKYKYQFVMLNTPLETCLKRNIGIGSVPEHIIKRMHEKYLKLLAMSGDIASFGEIKMIENCTA